MVKRVVVDADSCPVKKEIQLVGKELDVEVIFVASYAHFLSEAGDAKIYYVDSSDQSVDLFIMNFIKKDDLVITGDYGLASIVLKPGVKVLSFRGLEYTSSNIDELLTQRHVSAKVRRSGGKTKGPKPFTNIDREKFVENLRKSIMF